LKKKVSRDLPECSVDTTIGSKSPPSLFFCPSLGAKASKKQKQEVLVNNFGNLRETSAAGLHLSSTLPRLRGGKKEGETIIGVRAEKRRINRRKRF